MQRTRQYMNVLRKVMASTPPTPFERTASYLRRVHSLARKKFESIRDWEAELAQLQIVNQS